VAFGRKAVNLSLPFWIDLMEFETHPLLSGNKIHLHTGKTVIAASDHHDLMPYQRPYSATAC
jgi:hypothetical protein